MCLVRLGDECFRIGNFKEAEKQYETALEILPNYYLALSAKGKVRAAQGDLANSNKVLHRGTNRVPLVEIVITLGDLYLLQGNKEKADSQYALAEVIEQKFGNLDLKRLALLYADHDICSDEALKIATKEYERRKDVYTVYAWTLYKKAISIRQRRQSQKQCTLKQKTHAFFIMLA